MSGGVGFYIWDRKGQLFGKVQKSTGKNSSTIHNLKAAGENGQLKLSKSLQFYTILQ